MNTKLIKVIDKMLNSEDKIVSIERDKDEYYFEFPLSIFWSVKNWFDPESEETIHSLYFYPKFSGTIKNLIAVPWGMTSEDEQFIAYNTRDIKDSEFKGRLIQLEAMLKAKYFGADKVFDRIINEE